jgi:16S rRNA (guanine(966)-N(2))-methyltransferase RsmD
VTTLRITAGSLRGRRIPVPPRDVRPTSERARQAFFNIVSDRIDGARFLDLFAGSGIFSFEAVSRGAAAATAVDLRVEDITKRAAEWKVPVAAIAGDVLATLPRLRTRFELAYADPPYEYDRYDALLAAADDADVRLLAIEHRRRSDPFTVTPKRLKFERRAEYGEVWITFFA